MSRLTTAVLSATLLASACRVERTPLELIDHQAPIATVRDEAAAELQARLLAMGQALGRGDAAEAMLALSPAPDAYVLGAGPGAVLSGEEQIADVLAEFARAEGTGLREVEVSVGPRGNVAWFRGRLEGGAAPPLRLTGVYLRGDEGEWRLVQAHLSAATAPPEPPPADSLPSSPAAAAAPPGAGPE